MVTILYNTLPSKQTGNGLLSTIKELTTGVDGPGVVVAESKSTGNVGFKACLN